MNCMRSVQPEDDLPRYGVAMKHRWHSLFSTTLNSSDHVATGA
jgi:hypothetical protein